MKLKEVFYLAGIKPGTKEYLFDIDSIELPIDGEIQFARWRHPKEQRKSITQEQVNALREYLDPGDVAIDIGAHTGDTTIPLAMAVGAQGAVFALEPNRYVYKVLLANCSLNRTKTNIYPLMFAATETDGNFDFEYSDPGYCNGGRHDGIHTLKHAHFFKLPVQGRNLTHYLDSEFPHYSDRIRFIKIDTEGFDHQVVKTLIPMIERARPYIRSEIFRHTSQESRASYFETLKGLGYRVFFMNSEVDYQGVELRVDQMSDWEHFDIFAIPE